MYKEINIKRQKGVDITANILSHSEYYNLFCLYDSNNYTEDKYSRFEKLAAFGSIEKININRSLRNPEPIIENFLKKHANKWKFLYLNYSLKNSFEQLSSNNIDNLYFSNILIFIPKFVLIEVNSSLKLQYHSSIAIEEVNNFIDGINKNKDIQTKKQKTNIKLKARISKKQYLESIKNIRNHIQQGDIYEMNFCQEFFAITNEFIPINTFKELKKNSPAPFSAYFKDHNNYLLSFSPERYIQKQGEKLISQPIKGTAKRSSNCETDKRIKKNLENDKKELAENIMIVDLVRNDLSKISNTNVIAEELCKIYSFPQVHQMISTISTTISATTTFMDIIKSSFPMGSMTGAPKIRAMELIEKYESHERGLFSGSVGYIDPKGDFDLNVIIRSLLYNNETNYLSLSTGGAITFKSKAEEEYKESLLKAQAILDILNLDL